jgi:hypothetical protein
MKKLSTIFIVSGLALMTIGLALIPGCFEETQQKKVWGKGEPPAAWQGWFGNDNTARLDFVQSQTIDRIQAVMYGLNITDPNGQTVHKRGLIERITTLESLSEQVRKLEDTNIILRKQIEELETKGIIGKTVWFSYRGFNWKGVVLSENGEILTIGRSDGLVDSVPKHLCSLKDPNEDR